MFTTKENPVKEAVTELITSPDAPEMYQALTRLIPLVREGVPVRLSGNAAVCNPLLALYQSNPEGFHKALAIVERKRAALGFEPLEIQTKLTTRLKKNASQKALMERIRQRARRAVDIENQLRPERDRLVGNNRLEFMRLQTLRWGEQRNAFLEAARGPHGATLNRNAYVEAIQRFWEAVEADLEAQEAHMRKEAVKPRVQRVRPNGSLTALLQALEFDPYRKREPPTS